MLTNLLTGGPLDEFGLMLLYRDDLGSFGSSVFWFNATLTTFVCCLASINSRSFVYVCGFPFASSLRSSFTLSAYRSVLSVCSQQLVAGETFAIIVVLLFPVNESFKTYVSLLPLNGVCFLSRSSALMHSLRARSDLLISAPSILVYLFWSRVSAPRSLPARSMKDIIE